MGSSMGADSPIFMEFHSCPPSLALALPRRNVDLSYNAHHAPCLPIQSLGLAGDGPTHILLLRIPQNVRCKAMCARSPCAWDAHSLVVRNFCNCSRTWVLGQECR